MKRNQWVLLFVLACSLRGGTVAQAQPQADFEKLAEQLAPDIRAKLVAKLNKGDRVAVFPFGDSNAKVTLQMAQSMKELQGELINHLMKVSNSAFFVLDMQGLARSFANASIDPTSIGTNDVKATAASLKKLGVDAAVVGGINATSAAQLTQAGAKKVNVPVTIIYADGTTDQLGGSVVPDAVHGSATSASGRFMVQLFLTGGGTPVEIPLVTSKQPNSEFHRVFFAEIPNDLKFGTDAASYMIRLTNHGTPEAKLRNVKDRERVYGVVVQVDGVNTIYQNKADGSFGPVVLHPKHCAKWLLTGPGQRMVADNSQPTGYRLVAATDAGNLGNSVLEIRGFQTDDAKAAKFLFAKPGDGLIAETAGITNDIGIITVHFYPEDLAGDVELRSVAGGKLGTKAGAAVDNPVGKANPKLKANPVEVWRIFYRKKSDCPVPVADKQLVTGG